MSTPEPFDSRSFRFACDIVNIYRLLIELPEMPHAIARQLLRLGTSIGANLTEAKGAQTRPDSAARFTIALKEARETQYWLRLIIATKLARSVDLTSTLREATELVAILTVAARNLRKSKGSKSTEENRRG